MTDKCPILAPGWWQGYSSDTEDDEARALTARKLGILPEAVELRRNAGAVLARKREEQDGH